MGEVNIAIPSFDVLEYNVDRVTLLCVCVCMHACMRACMRVGGIQEE